MKLNIGCGKDIRDGYVNIDFRKLSGVDMVCDIRKGLPLEDGTVDHILARHILEHFPITDTDRMLSEWHRVITPGGSIRVEVPNVINQFKQWLRGETKIVYDGQNPTERFSQVVFGKQDYEGNCHYQLFDESRLREVLKRNGFVVEDYYEREREIGAFAWRV